MPVDAFGASQPAGRLLCRHVGRRSGDFPLRANASAACIDEPSAIACRLSLRLLVDHGVVEAFASDGRAALTHWAWEQPTGMLDVRALNLGVSAVSLLAVEAHGMGGA